MLLFGVSTLVSFYFRREWFQAFYLVLVFHKILAVLFSTKSLFLCVCFACLIKIATKLLLSFRKNKIKIMACEITSVLIIFYGNVLIIFIENH